VGANLVAAIDHLGLTHLLQDNKANHPGPIVRSEAPTQERGKSCLPGIPVSLISLRAEERGAWIAIDMIETPREVGTSCVQPPRV
jgi:hypothetical protein